MCVCVCVYVCVCVCARARARRNVAQLVEHRTVTPLTQVRFPGAAKDFSPRVNFQCRLCYVCPYIPCAIACMNICGHVKDPVVHDRVRWTMETLKHPACTVNWVVQLSHSWLSLGKATQISHGRNPIGTIQYKKKVYKEKSELPSLNERRRRRKRDTLWHARPASSNSTAKRRC